MVNSLSIGFSYLPDLSKGWVTTIGKAYLVSVLELVSADNLTKSNGMGSIALRVKCSLNVSGFVSE